MSDIEEDDDDVVDAEQPAVGEGVAAAIAADEEMDNDEGDEEEEEEQAAEEAPAPAPVVVVPVVRAKPKAKPVVKKSTYVSIDSDSESDYSDDGEGDSCDDDDDDDDGNREHGVDGTDIHHEVQTNIDDEVDIAPRLNGALGTRQTVRVSSKTDFGPKFTGESLVKGGYGGNNMPRHYAEMSIIRRLRVDVKDNEIHSLKKNEHLKLASISRGSLDAYRQMYFAAFRCMIRTGLELERGRQGKETSTLQDEAMREAVRMYYPIGGAI